MKELQIQNKKNEERMFKENQCLMSELVDLRYAHLNIWPKISGIFTVFIILFMNNHCGVCQVHVF